MVVCDQSGQSSLTVLVCMTRLDTVLSRARPGGPGGSKIFKVHDMSRTQEDSS